jgi:hypothetical protein
MLRGVGYGRKGVPVSGSVGAPHENSPSYSAYLKSPYRSIKHSTYFEAYDDLFARFRGKPITFVEIGILGGGSLFMWREFFGPEARIIGVDLDPNAAKWEKDGFEIFIGSQSDPAFWQEVIKQVGSMDIVLDDGGHTYEQQIVTTECLIENIKDGGLLVVEDTHTSYMSGFGPRKYSFIKYVARFIDRINSRFHQIDAESDTRAWSIRIYESIVAFHINRQASGRVSARTDNGGAADEARDMRYGKVKLKFLKDLDRNSSVIRRIPGVERAGSTLQYWLSATRNSNLSRYFK